MDRGKGKESYSAKKESLCVHQGHVRVCINVLVCLCLRGCVVGGGGGACTGVVCDCA